MIIVSPQTSSDNPNISLTEAFVVPGTAGINYNPGVWHHPLTVIDYTGQFAALVWEDGSKDDTEWSVLTSEHRFRVNI